MTITTSLTYSTARPDAAPDEPWIIDAVSRPGEWLYTFAQDPVTVPIADLRRSDFTPTLEHHGFELTNEPVSFDQEAVHREDPAAIAQYQDQMGRHLLNRTGATEVVWFDANVRQERTDVEVTGPRAHQRIHVDQNAVSARARVSRHAPERGHDGRFQIVNVWRPLLAPVRNFPLALCDFSSLDLAADLAVVRLDFPEWLRDRENFSLRFNPAHRWCFWSELTPDEALVFTCYDSASRSLAEVTGRGDATGLLPVAGLCPHTAFFDDEGPARGVLRTSIELRALLFY